MTPETNELHRLHTTLMDTAARLGISTQQERSREVLEAFRPHLPTAMIAIRVATNAAHDGELDCRVSLPANTDPYRTAVEQGLLAPDSHPLAAVVDEVAHRCPIDSYGIDTGVRGGFKKVWIFFPGGQFQTLEDLAKCPSMPPSLRAGLPELEAYGLTDRVGLLGIDDRERTLNVYFGDLPPSSREASTIRALHADLGLAAPSDRMVDFCTQAFGIYVTAHWDAPEMTRLSFSVMSADPTSLNIPLGPKIRTLIESPLYEAGAPCMVHAAMTSRGEEYYKLQKYYRYRPHRVNLSQTPGAAASAEDGGRDDRP